MNPGSTGDLATRRERGQELVEFAIILPLLVLVVFGALDLGRLFHAAIVVTNAARAGARYGLFYPDDVTGMENAVLAEAENSGIELTDDTIVTITRTCPDAAGCVSGHPLRMTVTYRFSLIMGWVISPATIDIARSVDMLVP